MTQAQRDKMNIHSVRKMQDYARKQSRALHLCRQVATASKHWHVQQHPDPNVKIIVSVQSSLTVSAWNKIKVSGGIYFDDNGKIQSAEKVFSAALNFWTEFIYGGKIAE